MNGTLDRWYVSGPLGVGTTFDETLDAHSKTYINSPTSLGSMFRHEGWETLNLLDSRVAGIGQGPNLNLWGLNGAKKAVRLGTISARFSATADAGSSSYLSFHTKPANGDVREVLRIDGDGNVNMVTSTSHTLTVGSGANGAIKVRHINGKHWTNDNDDGLYLNWDTAMPVVIGGGKPARLDVHGDLSIAGKHALRGNDPWLRLNQEGAFAAGVHTPGVLAPGSLNVGGAAGWGNPGGGNAWITGSLAVGTTNQTSRLHVAGNAGILSLEGTDHAYIQWYPRGIASRRAWTGFGTANTNSFDIRNDSPNEANNPGRMHIHTKEHLYLLAGGQTLVSKAWGGTGDLVVEGRIGVAGQSPTPRNTGWGGGIHTWDLEAEASIWTRNLHVEGNIRFTGNLTGGSKWGYVVDQFVNTVGETLERGDVVIVGGSEPTRSYGPNDSIPIPEVDLTEREYDTRICGIVSEIFDPAPDTDPRRVEPGQIGGFVTLGAFASCKVDADIAPIAVGDLLTSSPTRGHAQKVLHPERAAGAILGKALGALDRGRGTVPVLVVLQ